MVNINNYNQVSNSQTSSNSSKNHKHNLMDLLSDELLISIALYLDLSSLACTLQTCHRWRTLEQSASAGPYLWHNRVVSQYGPLRLLPNEDNDNHNCNDTSSSSSSFNNNNNNNSENHNTNEWKCLALRLEKGLGDYYGFAIDAFTSDFEPYPMILHYQRLINWPTLNNALTQLGNVQLHRQRQPQQQRDGMLKSIKFSEVKVLSGFNILIPNHYFGWVCGPAIVGVFANGAFCLIVKEALKESHGADKNEGDNEKQNSQQCDELGSSNQPFRTNMVFVGLVTMELVKFDPTQTIREPLPSKRLIVTLQLVDQMTPSEVKQKFKDTCMDELTYDPKHDVGFWAQLQLQTSNNGIRSGNNDADSIDGDKEEDNQSLYDYTIETIVLQCHTNNVEYDLVMFAVGDPLPVPGADATTNSRIPPDIVKFFCPVRLYGWLHSDCILGLMKNNHCQTGSFYMQLRHCNRLRMLGLQRALEETICASSSV